MDFNCCKTKKSKNNLGQISEFLKVIAEPNRLKILCLLQKQEMCVCDIWEYMKLSQNLVSHHLKVLKDFGLVETKKEGTKVNYRLNIKNFNKYKKLLTHFI